MKKNPFVVLFIFFALGIFTSTIFPIGIQLNILCLAFFILTYVLIEKLNITNLKSSVIKSIPLVLCFYFLGSTFFNLTNKDLNTKSINQNYLKGDLLLGKISSINSSAKEYKKIIFEVECLLRNKDSIFVHDQVLLFLKDPEVKLKPFDVCLINVELNPIESKDNPGEFDAAFYWKHKSIEFLGFGNESDYYKIGYTEANFASLFLNLRNYFSSILEKYLLGDELGVAKALILGDKSSLDAEVTSKFGNTGAMHVLAVSGLHVGILVQILTLVFGLFSRWISKKKAVLFAVLLIWVYAFMTGLSPSVVRAVIMFSLLVGSQVLEKEYSNFNVLAFSAFIILLWNPHFLFDLGFQLSYLAMLGIFMFYTPLSKVIYIKNKWLKMIYDGTMVGVAAQIMTVPLTLYYFHQFPNYFIITNIALMLFSFLILVFGLGLFTVNWAQILAKPVAWLLSFSLFLTLYLISKIDALPGSVSSGFNPKTEVVVLLFILILLFYYALKFSKFKVLLFSLVATIVLFSSIVFFRFKNMEQSHICFLQANEVNFIVKVNNQNFVFYGNKKKEVKKAEFIAKSYQKIYPGKLQFVEISNKKSTRLEIGKNQIFIERVRGGYEIQVNKNAYFYATNLNFESATQKVIYAPWISENTENFALSENSFLFSIK